MGTQIKTLRATVTCVYCPWSASLTGDEPNEVGGFLRGLLLAHTEEHHPAEMTADAKRLYAYIRAGGKP